MALLAHQPKELLKLKAIELQHICKQCGFATSGTKAQLVQNIQEGLRKDCVTTSNNIVSIDLGYKNLAFLHVANDRIIEWKRQDLLLPSSYDPSQFAQNLSEFIKPFKEMTDTLFLIERQRHRTGGSSMILETILKVLFVEYQLHAALLGRAVSILPCRVANYFQLEGGKMKKKSSVLQMTKMLEQGSIPIHIPSQLVSMFRKEKKSDDLSDCFLQYLAFMDWRKNRQEYASWLK